MPEAGGIALRHAHDVDTDKRVPAGTATVKGVGTFLTPGPEGVSGLRALSLGVSPGDRSDGKAFMSLSRFLLSTDV